jgi:hypothetical protein
MSKTLAALCGVLVLAGSGVAAAADVQGDYVEARTADVFTGPCFSNAEVFIYGSQAVLAWKVNAGSFQGVDLSGLSVAAAIKGTTTFSEDRPEHAKAVLIVDEKADSRQRAALASFASYSLEKRLGGARLGNIVDVKSTTMSLKIERHAKPGDEPSEHADHGMPHAPRATFWAAGLASILTRPLDGRDHFCGNEVVAYPPLSKGVNVLPAYTLGHQFKGAGLNTKWDDPNCRSAFVGSFTL